VASLSPVVTDSGYATANLGRETAHCKEVLLDRDGWLRLAGERQYAFAGGAGATLHLNAF